MSPQVPYEFTYVPLQHVERIEGYQYPVANGLGGSNIGEHRDSGHGFSPAAFPSPQPTIQERVHADTVADSWPNTNRRTPPAGVHFHAHSPPFYHDLPDLRVHAQGVYRETPGSDGLHSLYTANPYSNRHAFPSAQHPLNGSFSQQSTVTRPGPWTIWWGNLEGWMDEQYVKDACAHMGWKPVQIGMPQAPSQPLADIPPSVQPNNVGYCLLTFSSQQEAAAVLSQISAPHGGNPVVMPNSSRAFEMNWLSAVPPSSLALPPMPSVLTRNAPQHQSEYSIFVGDLAPEASNSDLVAVFRDPSLGLRTDRAPKNIQPFHSCKSAKIMLDAVTGVSKGYGFVRFTDERDQQRALVEMHGLYCLHRPMRISAATAKFKPQPITVAVPMPSTSVIFSPGSTSPTSSSSSVPTLSSSSSGSSGLEHQAEVNVPLKDMLQPYYDGMGGPSARASPSHIVPHNSVTARFARGSSPESPTRPAQDTWLQTNAGSTYLQNMIGPNGELTWSDPYNTTVFVGGLSPLILEDTLKTFFEPFGPIHYVKVPVGKHCGFVQFVRKADAEEAIKKMQGYAIGGSRLRLSWGRSQYKAAQAAVQAAKASDMQAQIQAQIQSQSQAQTQHQHQQRQAHAHSHAYPHLAPPPAPELSPQARRELLQLLQANGYDLNHGGSVDLGPLLQGITGPPAAPIRRPSSFSPFSPQPNMYEEVMAGGSTVFAHAPVGHGRAEFMPGLTRPAQPTPRQSTFGARAPVHDEDDSFAESSSILDLNGTLASLDLDSSAGSWRHDEKVGRL